VTGPQYDPADPLFTPLTIDEAAQVAGRTRRTIDQWIKDELLEVVKLENPPRRVVVKRQLLDLEVRRRKAALKGRPRKNRGEQGTGTPESV
jgi:hypothetical protein